MDNNSINMELPNYNELYEISLIEIRLLEKRIKELRKELNKKKECIRCNKEKKYKIRFTNIFKFVLIILYNLFVISIFIEIDKL